MKCIVIYHTVTGNTKKIAEGIKHGILQAGDECDIANLEAVKSGDLKAYDLIGLGSPVYKQRELQNVTLFIQNAMKFVDGRHGFAFCTHGATPGYYLARVVPGMAQRGLTMIGWNDWFGSCFHPAIPKPYFTDGHPDAIDMKEAEDFGREMAERSRRIYHGETGLIPKFPTGSEYDDIYLPTPGPSKEILDVFYREQANLVLKVNLDKCKYPKCTFCIDNCPMHSIDFSVSPPLFNINCDRCWLCEQACPNGAIELDWEAYDKAHIPMLQPLIKSLEVFEARGKFRWLVPMDKIGWDNHLCKLKHPRFKVQK